MGDTARAQ